MTVPNPTIKEILSETFTKPFTWNARTTRKGFWLGVLFMWIVSWLTLPVTVPIVEATYSSMNGGTFTYNFMPTGISTIGVFLAYILSIYLWLCSLGLVVRRLHDSGHSGWWYWIMIVPVIGHVWLLILLIFPTKLGAVRWGSYLY